MGSESGEPSVDSHTPGETGYTVNVAGLLFTPERDFLVKNNGHKVRVDDLNDKTIVLYIVPLYDISLQLGDSLDMVEAYNEILPRGGVEFIFVPVYLPKYNADLPGGLASQEGLFNYLFSALPFPTIPFSEVESCGDRVVQTFSVDHNLLRVYNLLPYWVIIDHTNTVVATRFVYHHLFKLFGGAELHPLSLERIRALWDEYQLPDENHNRSESRKRLISKWDQLLASPTRDFVLSSNGDQVPISSLKDKVVGLYFCRNIPHHYSMEMIKKVYQEAKSRCYDFEIVQINFHYYCFNTRLVDSTVGDMSVLQCNESVNWLTLPFRDPSCRKLKRIFRCDFDEDEGDWTGDRLVIIDPRQADTNGVVFEFSGIEILRHYGVEGYPFTRQHLYEIEYEIQDKRVTSQPFFPPGLCHLIRPAGDGFDMTDGSQLTGKRVLVLFGNKHGCEYSGFVKMLKSKYCEQLNDEAEENKFEVVYVSTDCTESRFSECIKDMPWLVYLPSTYSGRRCRAKMMKLTRPMGIGAMAFDTDGELIAKGNFHLGCDSTSYNKPCFPFISLDWKEWIRGEVGRLCQLHRHYSQL